MFLLSCFLLPLAVAQSLLVVQSLTTPLDVDVAFVNDAAEDVAFRQDQVAALPDGITVRVVLVDGSLELRERIDVEYMASLARVIVYLRAVTTTAAPTMVVSSDSCRSAALPFAALLASFVSAGSRAQPTIVVQHLGSIKVKMISAPPTPAPTPAPTTVSGTTSEASTVATPTPTSTTTPTATSATSVDEFSFKLPVTVAGGAVWTAPATYRVASNDVAPTTVGSTIVLHAARHEFEPLQIVVASRSGSLQRVTLTPFATLGGTGARIDAFVAAYAAGLAEWLSPLVTPIALSSNSNTVLWFDIFVPRDATPGKHLSMLTIDDISIAIELNVFKFAIPPTASFNTMMDMGVSLGAGRSTDEDKAYLLEHRWTPKSGPTWPSGFSYGITWDSSVNPQRCKEFFDEPNEGAPYSIGKLAKKFLLGDGWPAGRGVGFPSCQLLQFVDNATPRPATFCGEVRGSSHNGTQAYNTAWKNYLSALSNYIEKLGALNKTYYYTINEPQNAIEEALAAHLCRLSKSAAPKLRLAVSEEPKPSIAEDVNGACGYDIWIAHLSGVDSSIAYAKKRILLGEQMWLYSLPQDAAPWWLPTRLDSQGVHVRAIAWSSWALRVSGYAYYDAMTWLKNGYIGIRGKLFRETFEDFEYILLANSRWPMPDVQEKVDATVASIATGINSWSKNANSYHTLKRELGLFIEGSRTTLPILTINNNMPRQNHFLNFQDPDGNPKDNPLIVNGNEYKKIGWATYSTARGYGWSSETVNNPAIALYGNVDIVGFNKLESSFVFDDYGRHAVFEYDISPGEYNVTCSVGWPGKAYANDPQNLWIENMHVVNDVITTATNSIVVAFALVNIVDGQLTIEIGGMSGKIFI